VANESFFSRWSRRKNSPEQEPEATETLTEDLQEQVETEEEQQPELTDADMPDIDSLNEESDYSQFMSPGVSDALRQMALRKMFQLPEFNIRDGLNDYDEDFSNFKVLSEAAASEIRNWLDEKTEEIKEEILESDNQPEKETEQTASTKSTETANRQWQQEDDELGDADLEG